jgi:hypothetical protein
MGHLAKLESDAVIMNENNAEVPNVIMEGSHDNIPTSDVAVGTATNEKVEAAVLKATHPSAGEHLKADARAVVAGKQSTVEGSDATKDH